jgi:hypothetical protein
VHDRLPPVPHSDTTGHLVRRGAVRALFSLHHALHIGRQFSEFSGISNTLLSLRFGILLFFVGSY